MEHLGEVNLGATWRVDVDVHVLLRAPQQVMLVPIRLPDSQNMRRRFQLGRL